MLWMNLTNIMLSEKKPDTRDHVYDSIDLKCQELANLYTQISGCLEWEQGLTK